MVLQRRKLGLQCIRAIDVVVVVRLRVVARRHALVLDDHLLELLTVVATVVTAAVKAAAVPGTILAAANQTVSRLHPLREFVVELKQGKDALPGRWYELLNRMVRRSTCHARCTPILHGNVIQMQTLWYVTLSMRSTISLGWIPAGI